MAKMRASQSEKPGIREPTPSCGVRKSGSSRGSFKHPTEAEGEKGMVNLFERKLGTSKEKVVETANSRNSGSLTFAQGEKPRLSRKPRVERTDDTKKGRRIVPFDGKEEKSGHQKPQEITSTTLPPKNPHTSAHL